MDTFLAYLLCIIVGCVVVVPYTFLAGWDKHHLPFIILAPSMVLLVLHIFFRLPRKFLNDFSLFWKGFWTIVIYCLLPIFSNVVSILLGWMGYTATSKFIFQFRYASLVAVPLTLFFGRIFLEDIRELRRYLRRKRARNYLQKMGYLRSTVAESADEAGKHCGPKILEEYALGMKPLPTWVVMEIDKHLEACCQCRGRMAEILQNNLP